MTVFKKKGSLIPLCGAILLLTTLLVAGTALAEGGPPQPVEIHGLQERPDLPVNSVILRRDFPDHPLGGPPGLDREPGGGSCDKDIDLTSTASGVVNVAAQDNGICTSADIDTYVRNGTTYVVQGGGEEAAWTHTELGSDGVPVAVWQYVWSGAAGRATYTPDVKAFQQGANDYIALSLERTKVNAFCGVVIVKVSDPANPVIDSQATGQDWCDVHNTFVEDGADGDADWIYLTADGPNDMRVLDIGGGGSGSVTNPIEVGRYIASTANNDNYVHDITVVNHGGSVGRRVYLAYWDTGLVVLNAADVTPGNNPTPVIGPNELDPGEPNQPDHFLNHHSFPTQDGNFVFIQDEFLNESGRQPVQMWDVSNPANPTYVDGLVLGTDTPANPAHNLEIRFDINPNRLYVGWYKLGLQAWDFTTVSPAGFTRPRALYHQVQTEMADDPYSGAWGVRLAQIGTDLYIVQSDRNYGLIVDRVGTPPPPQEGTVTGTVTDSSTGLPIAGASVSADTGQSDTTDANGDYTLSNVPAGTRTVTASATGYVTQQQQTNVTDGGVSVVDFALDPEPTGGGTGTIKGTVTGPNGRGLGGAVVEADGSSATTNNGGKYSLDVAAGTYAVTVTSPAGCSPASQEVTVADGQTVSGVNFSCP